MPTYRLEIPGFKPSLDNHLIGRHWGAKARLKSRDAGVVLRANLVSRVPLVAVPPGERKQRKALGIGPQPSDPRPVRRRVAVEVRHPAYLRPQCRPDPLAPLKSLLDALVRCGLLVDDSSRWCELADPPCSYLVGHVGTTVILEDL